MISRIDCLHTKTEKLDEDVSLFFEKLFAHIRITKAHSLIEVLEAIGEKDLHRVLFWVEKDEVCAQWFALCKELCWSNQAELNPDQEIRRAAQP